MVKRIILLSFGALLNCSLHAQNIKPMGGFFQDSLKIGENVHYSLSIEYPKDWQVIFPDSTYDYAPFEFNRKEFSTTRVDSTMAFDSVVYHISSFEIDSLQKLQLPVFLIKQNDSIPMFADFDSIYLQHVVTVMPDSLVLKSNVNFRELDYPLNYIYIGIGIAVFLILVVAAYLVFGQSIINRYRLYLLNKDYQKFALEFDAGVDRVKSGNDNTNTIESLVFVWKKFMERLEDRPFTKYTSKEIIAAGYGENLKGVLKKIDESIYGNMKIEDIYQNLDALSHYTSERFEIKKEEVVNG